MLFGFKLGQCDQCHKRGVLCAELGQHEEVGAVIGFCEECYPEYFDPNYEATMEAARQRELDEYNDYLCQCRKEEYEMEQRQAQEWVDRGKPYLWDNYEVKVPKWKQFVAKILKFFRII